MNTTNLYRAQQHAIAAAIYSGDYSKASDLLRQDLQEFAQPPPTTTAKTGHKKALTPRRKCGIIKAIRRYIRRRRKKNRRKRKWLFTAER